jgi:hypothetical protein
MEVTGDEHRGAALGFEKTGELGGGGGFSSAIEAHNEDACGFGKIDRGSVTPQERTEFLVENFNNLLARCDASQDLLAESFFLNTRDKILRDLEIHIRVEQSQPHLAKGISHVRLRDPALPAKVFENVL